MPMSSKQIPFDRWFQIEPIREYQKVITMKKFMKDLAPKVWPAAERKGFCYRPRSESEETCGMKEGNPFGPFWDHFGISFKDSVFHEELLWSTHKYNVEEWHRKFPAGQYPVYAFPGAPGNFPSLPEHHSIQKYLHFSKLINRISDEYIENELEGKPFLAIHLRNGLDMTRVCDEIDNDKYHSLFSSAQCTQLEGNPKLTSAMCNPPKEDIIQKVVHHIKKMKLKALFIATDNDPMIKDFKKAFKAIKFPVSIHRRVHKDVETECDGPLIDIALMSKADMFIGNCVSSFTAFVRRQRFSRGKQMDFFNLKSNKPLHTEL
ncbi:GDP-fucose protein O-fucosyltransferase 1-like isoform X2 [Clytia hemisphaerica]